MSTQRISQEQLSYDLSPQVVELITSPTMRLLDQAQKFALLNFVQFRLIENATTKLTPHSTIPASSFEHFSFFITGSGSITYTIETLDGYGTWIPMTTNAVTGVSTDPMVVTFTGTHKELRARIISYSSGTWSISAYAKTIRA